MTNKLNKDKFEGTSGIIALPPEEYKPNNVYDPVPVVIGEEIEVHVFGALKELHGEHYKGFVVAIYEDNFVDLEVIIHNAVIIADHVPYKVHNGTFKQGMYWHKKEEN